MKRVSNRAWRGGKMRVCADCHSATAFLEHFGKVNVQKERKGDTLVPTLTTPLHAPDPPSQFILPLILPAQLTAQISAQHQQMKWFCLDSCPRQRRGDRIVPTTHLPRTPGVIHVPGVSLGLVRGKWLCYSFERWRLRTENCPRHPQSPWQCCGVLGGLSLSCSQQVFQLGMYQHHLSSS